MADSDSNKSVEVPTQGEKLVEVKLDRPYTTNGVTYGYEDDVRDGKKVKVFTGKANVPKEVADDLESRQATYREYEAGLHRNKGSDNPVFL